MILRFLPMTLVMAAIFFLSNTQGQNLPSAINGLDKILHALAYATLAASCLYGLHPAARDKGSLRPAAGVVFFCFCYGLTDEFHQSFIPGRSPSGLDIVADTGGAVLTVLLWHGWRTRRRFSRLRKGLGAG
ncbi:MAG: teicoplanin resistance protein VanZ [Desulfurivibrio sp.]|nr:MAG: teicoplanin resistance protein VanZ [Desulfurivibrio sp.]